MSCENNEFLKRIRSQALRSKITSAEETVPLFQNGMYLGFSGFSEGHPKLIPNVLAQHVERNHLVGKMRFNVYTGASIGNDVDDLWARLRMLDRRWPQQHGVQVQKSVNQAEINFGDRHLSMYAQDFGYGFYTLENEDRIDIAVIEASALTEDGGIVPTLSVGIVAEIVARADKIIVEINTKLPSLEGIHDCVAPAQPPNKKPYLIVTPTDRIGTMSIPCDPEKIVAIVESRRDPVGKPIRALTDPSSQLIAGHIIDFLQWEVKKGRLPENLLPLQSGVGSIANAVIGGFLNSSFQHLTVWTEVFQDTLMDLFDAGKLDFVTAASFSLSENGLQRLVAGWERYIPKTILRPVQITNHPELIRRLGVIAMNTPVEFDIYGHVNSSNIGGSKVITGIGGSGDFTRNAYLSIMHTPSTRPTRTDPTGISCVLPMVTHVDHTEHDLDVLVTEQGLADLRGLAPRQRAKKIIDACAHPDYRPILHDYFDRALRECVAANSAHQPHLLQNVFKMHGNLARRGTMKVTDWD